MTFAVHAGIACLALPLHAGIVCLASLAYDWLPSDWHSLKGALCKLGHDWLLTIILCCNGVLTLLLLNIAEHMCMPLILLPSFIKLYTNIFVVNIAFCKK